MAIAKLVEIQNKFYQYLYHYSYRRLVTGFLLAALDTW